jgi:hypothetical protein
MPSQANGAKPNEQKAGKAKPASEPQSKTAAPTKATSAPQQPFDKASLKTFAGITSPHYPPSPENTIDVLGFETTFISRSDQRFRLLVGIELMVSLLSTRCRKRNVRQLNHME